MAASLGLARLPCLKHRPAETAARHPADGKGVLGELRTFVLQVRQKRSDVVGRVQTTPFYCDDVDGIGDALIAKELKVLARLQPCDEVGFELARLLVDNRVPGTMVVIEVEDREPDR